MKTEYLNRLLQDRKAKRQFASLTHLDTGAQALVYTDGEIHGDLPVDDNMHVAALNAVQDDRSTTYEGGNGDVFIQVYNPPLRLITPCGTDDVEFRLDSALPLTVETGLTRSADFVATAFVHGVIHPRVGCTRTSARKPTFAH